MTEESFSTDKLLHLAGAREGSAAPPAAPMTGEERDRSYQRGNRDIKHLRGDKMHFRQGSVNIHVIFETSRLFIDDYIEWRVI